MFDVQTPLTGRFEGTWTTSLFSHDLGFAGINETETPIDVADTMGAMGPTNYFEVLNGTVRAYDKVVWTNRVQESLSRFFAVGNQTWPMRDPRVLYDPGSQRWVTCAIAPADDKVILKVSATMGAIPLTEANWPLLSHQPITLILAPDELPDYTTLGYDANGVYVSVQIQEGGAQRGFRILAYRKPDVYVNPTYVPPPPLVVTAAEVDTWCIQPASNLSSSPGDYTWFVAKGPVQGGAGGRVYYRPLQWNGNTVGWAAGWQPVTDPPAPGYRDYYDIPQLQPFETNLLSAPQNGSSTILLSYTGSRLMNAVVRNGYLYTCHHVGLDGSDGDYDPPNAVDRSGIQWLKLAVSGNQLVYQTHGRIYDGAGQPCWYYFPSLAVNNAGDMVIGFSGSKASEYIGTFVYGRRASGAAMPRPQLLRAGRTGYYQNRWGDYSATTIDPVDGSFWTVQEYADYVWYEPEGDWLSRWGTWIGQVTTTP